MGKPTKSARDQINCTCLPICLPCVRVACFLLDYFWSFLCFPVCLVFLLFLDYPGSDLCLFSHRLWFWICPCAWFSVYDPVLDFFHISACCLFKIPLPPHTPWLASGSFPHKPPLRFITALFLILVDPFACDFDYILVLTLSLIGNSAFIFWWKKRHPQQRRWHRICRKPTGQLRAQWRTNARWLTRSRRGNLQERFLQTAQEIWRLLHHSRTESQRRLPHSQREQDGCTDQHLLWKWIQRIQILKQHQKW